MQKRYPGVDLHRNQFTVCVRLEKRQDEYAGMEAGSLSQFVKKLRATDEVAVEVTGNTRLFHDAVAPHVARIAVVNTNQFRGITQSMKRTDANDADTALGPASRNPVVRFQLRRPLPAVAERCLASRVRCAAANYAAPLAPPRPWQHQGFATGGSAGNQTQPSFFVSPRGDQMEVDKHHRSTYANF